ncbi:F-box/kelch-repeat protein At3g23880-like isoform X2 [Apium graveolens]|uniref:F-box/kelch-repeat protein At3g23880-like isoform X2 n=1 Tax=Apium graveolens TaxID=4045 RepID=UPI003D7B0250
MSSNQINNSGTMFRRQAKIVNSIDNDCPRLNNNNNSLVVRRARRFFKWGSGKIKFIPRVPVPRITNISCRNKKRKHKSRLPGFFHSQLRMMRGNSSSPVLKKSKKAMSLEKPKYLINYQFTSSSGPVLKRHGNRLRIHDLPKELLAEILIRLPVKDILRCRSVQKSWNYFVMSPVFISLQLNYQKQIVTGIYNPHYPKYLLFHEDDSLRLTVRFDDLQCEEYCKLEFLPGLPNDDVDVWFALSYGLICMSTILFTSCDHMRNIYLWNPLVKKYKTLPKSPLPSTKNRQAWEALAFGFLPEVDDYVVIHIIKPCLPPHPHSVIIGVYSLKTNSWKKSSQDNVFISTIISDPDNVVFINGVAFWVGVNSDKQRTLLCFDTKTDILCEISLPDWVAYLPLVPVIHQFGQSMAYFVWDEEVNHFDMWVLKYDHIDEFTWEKKMCVTPSKHVEEEVLGVRNNGQRKFLNREAKDI